MSESPHEFLHPKGWKATPGYSCGVAARGRMVFLGGLIGWNADQEFETDDFAGQVRQVLDNIVTVLATGGAQPDHIVRMTWYVTDKTEYLNALKEIGAYKSSEIIQQAINLLPKDGSCFFDSANESSEILSQEVIALLFKLLKELLKTQHRLLILKLIFQSHR